MILEKKMNCIAAINASIPANFSLSEIRQKRGYEYGFVSIFLDDSLFPQEQFLNNLDGRIKVHKINVDFIHSYSQIKNLAITENQKNNLLLRTIDLILEEKVDFLDHLKDFEIVIPITSFKKDSRNLFLTPSLKFNLKWEWWANPTENKPKNKSVYLTLQTTKR